MRTGRRAAEALAVGVSMSLVVVAMAVVMEASKVARRRRTAAQPHTLALHQLRRGP